MHTWHSLADSGDEWLVAYACIPPAATGASLYSIGHAIELYLKAAHTVKFGDIGTAIGFGHRLWDIWNACRANDSGFMSAYQFRDEVRSIDLLDPAAADGLGVDARTHLIEHQLFYLVLKHLPDLKYFGLPWKTRKPMPSAVGFVHPDSRWIDFVRELRRCIGHPARDRADRVEQLIDSQVLPEVAANYLRGLYG